MNIRARCGFTEAKNKTTTKSPDGDSTIPKIAMFLTELLLLKVSTKRKKQNLQQLLVAVQHW